MRILYLYSEVMGYSLATMRALVDAGVELHVVHWDTGKMTPYRMESIDGLNLYARSQFKGKTRVRLLTTLVPDITVVSGWLDWGYLSAARELRKRGSVVVVGLDGQWFATYRQIVASILCRAGLFRFLFSHAWVAGVYQYEFARKLGFKKRDIIFDLYSANLELFDSLIQLKKRGKHPHRFLYVGRLEPVKGLDTLLRSWAMVQKVRGDWELHLVGNGSLSESIECSPGLVIKNFLQPDELKREFESAGCFVLPSHYEPWGVVVHEAAAAGLPLILSDSVGAAATFLVERLNGFCFETGNASSLANCLICVMNDSDQRLKSMSIASSELAKRITPQTSAANLLGLADHMSISDEA